MGIEFSIEWKRNSVYSSQPSKILIPIKNQKAQQLISKNKSMMTSEPRPQHVTAPFSQTQLLFLCFDPYSYSHISIDETNLLEVF
jgi:hypothetical protein